MTVIKSVKRRDAETCKFLFLFFSLLSEIKYCDPKKHRNVADVQRHKNTRETIFRETWHQLDVIYCQVDARLPAVCSLPPEHKQQQWQTM